jgi:hypothetical protein
MIAGIKVGPLTWKRILHDYRPGICEVWFRVDWLDRYSDLFAFLRRDGIPAGLHFWGILADGIAPNFAYPDEEIRRSSVELVKRSIDTAVHNGFLYVNIHPGSYRLSRVNLDRLFFRPIPGREVSEATGSMVLHENIKELDTYAQKLGVHLLTETLPAREPMHWRSLIKGRLKTQDMRNVPVSQMVRLAQQGFFICNDLCHTAMDVVSDDRDFLFQQLLEKTKLLSDKTRLIHVNTMPPPFNGTDGHLGIRKQDFTEEVFPSREQMKQLLSLFVDRDDVWVIPEPFSDHIENTKALEELLEEIKEEG